MIKQIAIFFIAFASTSLFSCNNFSKNTKSSYILSTIPKIRSLEKVDHDFCNSLNINYGNKNSKQSQKYWRCRLSAAKFRFKTEISTPEDQNHNQSINDLASKISAKLALSPESLLENASIEIENIEHRQCLKMGFDLSTDNQVKVDEYFACRKILIEERFAIPPFRKADYLKYKHGKYNTSFAIDQAIDKKIEQFKKAQEQYPECVKYKIASEEFKNCTIAYDNMDKCLLGINKKKFHKEVENKITCQRQAFLRFPNEMSKDVEDNESRLKKINSRSDYYNKNDFIALGIGDISQFNSETEQKDKEIQNSDSQQIESTKQGLINSNKNLYARFELTKLREHYINICQKNTDSKIKKYQQSLKDRCLAIIKNFQ